MARVERISDMRITSLASGLRNHRSKYGEDPEYCSKKEEPDSPAQRTECLKIG